MPSRSHGVGGRSRSPRRVAALAAPTLVALGVAACGGYSKAPAGGPTPRAPGAPAPAAFSWLTPAPAPAGWHGATIASGRATLAYPPGWKRTYADAGSVSAALRNRHGFFRGYLNATPRQGDEQLAGWAKFRVERNRAEGSGNVRLIASAENLAMRGGRGSCVVDDYSSRIGGNRYRELACIVRGSHATTVFIGAAQPREWSTLGAQIERAVASFQAR